MDKTKKRRSVGGRPRSLTDKDKPTIIAELRRFAPLCTIASKLGVARMTLWRFINAHEDVKSELQDCNESMIDLTQRALWDESVGNFKRDARGHEIHISVNAATFMLERLGKSRGYGQNVVVETPNVPTFTFCRATADTKGEAQQSDGDGDE